MKRERVGDREGKRNRRGNEYERVREKKIRETGKGQDIIDREEEYKEKRQRGNGEKKCEVRSAKKRKKKIDT